MITAPLSLDIPQCCVIILDEAKAYVQCELSKSSIYYFSNYQLSSQLSLSNSTQQPYSPVRESGLASSKLAM